MNKVILMGRLTRDPEMRQTPQGTAVASFSIAVNRRFAKEGQQQADFINCVAWRQQAEFICKYFQKGAMIAIAGSIQTRTWDGQDGKKQYATEVLVDEAHFTGSKQESGSSNSGSFNQSFGSGFQQQPKSQPSIGGAEPNFDDFDTSGFAVMDGSEDDLPF